MNIKEHLAKQTYDKYYQDIECLGHVGYAQSWKSWDNIKDLVKWHGKTVLDIGTFHGYFCFKALEAGAKDVIGIDKNPDVIATTKMINAELGTSASFFNNTANSMLPSADIILVLNVFHHIQEQDKFFESFPKGQQFIMEIDKEDLTKVEKHCIINVQKLSHRPSAYTGDVPNRLVLLAEKK